MSSDTYHWICIVHASLLAELEARLTGIRIALYSCHLIFFLPVLNFDVLKIPTTLFAFSTDI